MTIGEYGARFGARVAIVEAERLAGDCTWHGCVPSKALLASAHVAALVRQTERYGLPAASLPAIDLGRVMERVHTIQQQIYSEKDSPERFRAMGCALSGKSQGATLFSRW